MNVSEIQYNFIHMYNLNLKVKFMDTEQDAGFQRLGGIADTGISEPQVQIPVTQEECIFKINCIEQ